MKKYEAIVFDLGGTLIEYAGEFETWPELESPGLSAAHSVFRFHGIQMPSLSHFKAVGFNLLPDLWLQAISGNQNLTVNSFL